MARPLPIARVIALWQEELQLSREAQADSYRVIKRHIKAISALTSLTPYEHTKLAQCDAMIESARASRRAYEADMADRRHHTPCGPAKAIQGRAYYAVLHAKHDSSEYMAITQDGVYSHSEPLSGPARVDTINLMSDRLPATDSLASATIGQTKALNRYNSDIRHSVHMANKLGKRSHRKSKRGGKRARKAKHNTPVKVGGDFIARGRRVTVEVK